MAMEADLPFVEVWRDIKGYEGLYQVSNYGRVKSLARITPRRHIPKKEIIRCLSVDKDGYLCVNLCKEGIVKVYKVHRLVGEAFLDNPLNLPLINHINGIKNDNRVSNLEWIDASGNAIHAFRTGLRCSPRISLYGEKNHHCKLSDADCEAIRALKREFNYTNKHLSEMFNIGTTQIGRIINGEQRVKGSVRIG